jgi:cation-transporting ATPase 13A1
MDFDKSFISGLEFLVPSGSLHVILNSVFAIAHSVVAGLLVASMGDPYRAVIEELTQEAAKNGTVLTLEEIKSSDENPIPSESAPNPVFVIAMIVSIGLHVLFYLAQKWSVVLRIRLQYRRVASIRNEPSNICVYPPEFRGKPEILPLVPSVGPDGSRRRRFDFQRRKFEIVSDESVPRVELLSYPLNVPIRKFVSENNGIDSSEVARRQSMYGLNMVDIPVPPFYKLYLEQLLSPIPIFQLFCSALWMMDEYWKYTLFTLLTIFGFEVSTTVQRKKSLETLRSMSGKVIVPVLAKRNSSFVQITSEQLVPGDRIKLFPNTTVVPCDCLLVGGSAVVNEASLTGESVPQMKDAVDDSDDDRILDIAGRDKVHCVFAGTTLIRSDSNQLELVVVRTGSQSSQGELLRMVEFSQQQVSSDKKDTMWLLLLLLVFAIAAASYVVYERVSGTGSENLTKMKTHKLVLRVIMIITSVVPPELPLQMSLAVNTALMALHKIGIFCTEPFRVPMAGSVTHCFFDKTGTLTSDKLECHGLSTRDNPMTQTVVAGCHSLIDVDGKLLGDPVEQTALEFIGWRYFASENRAVSPDGKREVKIIHRFHFSSQLQRMSCVVSDEKGKSWAVVKGSPEVIFERLVNRDKSRIEDLNRQYEDLAHTGKRVLALGYKSLKSSSHIHREEAECDLEFAGFASFGCETRADTLTVINALSQSAELPCIMVTGDALLTAVHVARDTGIIIQGQKILRLEKDSANFVWREISTDSQRRLIPFVPGTTAKLSREFGLVVSGSDLPPAPTENAESISSIWADAVPYIRVFARMSPSQKEQVIGLIRSRGGHPLMCGDGGNDVGALKQADVGVALLAGFGSANTATTPTVSSDIDPEDQLEKDARIVALKEKKLGAKMKAEFEEKKKSLLAKQQEWMNEELAKPGNAGYWSAIKTVTARLREELAKESKDIQAKYGAAAWNRKQGGLLEILKNSSDNHQQNSSSGGAPVVQMGDASVAAPFTSRAPSIRSVVQIIRQGRCTLLVAVQMMQIMMLESLISAYTFAAITMEGGRSTEIQLIGSSIFVMVASIAFTYAKPNKKLSNVIPLKSVFNPAIFFSVVFQVIIHLGVLVYAMWWAKTEMGPDALQSLYDFERDRDEKLTKMMNSESTEESDNWLLNLTGGMDMLNMFKSVPYRPNLLNTVMFLVKTSQQVSVLVVNYKGSPWMQGALENKALFLSMFACAIGIVVCSTGYIPWINQSLELMVLPNHLRNNLLVLLGMSTVGAFIVDRLTVFVFAREIFFASTLRPLMRTTLADFLPILKTCAYIAGGVLLLPLVIGNPIGMIAGFYGFKMYKKWKEDREMAELEAELAK